MFKKLEKQAGCDVLNFSKGIRSLPQLLPSGRSGGGCLKKEPTFTGRLSELNSHNYENSKTLKT
jgi:hypothetical protein